MPKRASYTLTWSSSNQAYALYEGQEDDLLALAPGSPAWSAWVSQVSSFAFHGQHGSCTVRKERKRRGGGYWYAYARVEGNLTKRYLGRDSELTLARLEQVTQAFRLDPPAAVHPGQARASSPLQLAAPTPRGAHGLLADSVSQAHAWSSAGTRPQRDNGVGGRQRERENGGGDRQAEVSALLAGLPSEPLLATKLHAPRRRAHLVQRPRLLQRVQEGRERALTLLSAPAGFGKSTLLGDWLSSGAIPAAWLSLEPRDDDPARFLSYLLTALQTYDPQLGRLAQALHHPLPSPPVEAVLTLLINDLLVHRADDQERFVLVLDDYHVITNGSIHSALSFLLEHRPPQLHLVLVTRQDPPLPLARL